MEFALSLPSFVKGKRTALMSTGAWIMLGLQVLVIDDDKGNAILDFCLPSRKNEIVCCHIHKGAVKC